MAEQKSAGTSIGSGQDCLLPARTLRKAADVGAGKASMPHWRAFLLAVMAGLFIAMGAALMLVVKSDSSLGFASSQILSGLVFSVGLFLVVVAGAELFTGNNLMVIGCLSGRYGASRLVGSWLTVYAGNFVGSLLLVLILVGANFAGLNGGAVGVPRQAWRHQRHPSRPWRPSAGASCATCWCALRCGCPLPAVLLPTSSLPA